MKHSNEENFIFDLEKISGDADFLSKSEIIVDRWISEHKGFELVNPILVFMEKNPYIDYGMPGPLVHFLERFYRHGYEKELVSSIRRRPTPHTVWMLNRVINGEKDINQRLFYIDELKKARHVNQLSEDTLNQIEHFLSLV